AAGTEAPRPPCPGSRSPRAPPRFPWPRAPPSIAARARGRSGPGRNAPSLEPLDRRLQIRIQGPAPADRVVEHHLHRAPLRHVPPRALVAQEVLEGERGPSEPTDAHVAAEVVLERRGAAEVALGARQDVVQVAARSNPRNGAPVGD